MQKMILTLIIILFLKRLHTYLLTLNAILVIEFYVFDNFVYTKLRYSKHIIF